MADPAVVAHAQHHVVDVGADDLAEVGDGVDERELHGQEGVRRVLDGLGRGRVGDHQGGGQAQVQPGDIIVVKGKLLSGFRSPYVPGWDCHGLPIELAVEKEIGKVGVKVDARTFRVKCREYASKQIDSQREDFKRLGVLGYWDTPYRTMDFKFEADMLRALAQSGALKRCWDFSAPGADDAEGTKPLFAGYARRFVSGYVPLVGTDGGGALDGRYDRLDRRGQMDRSRWHHEPIHVLGHHG